MKTNEIGDKSMPEAVLLGTGILEWGRWERITNRYGTVKLFAEVKGGKNIELIKIIDGTWGKLLAKVIETREPYHIGDLFRDIYPLKPNVDEVFELGKGHLFYEDNESDHRVGLVPQDGRKADWLDPHHLYRVHNQTVELWFMEMKKKDFEDEIKATLNELVESISYTIKDIMYSIKEKIGEHQHPVLEEIIFVSEFEWNSNDDFLDGFEKLIVTSAQSHLSIFNVQRGEFPYIIDKMIERINAYSGTEKGDRYLFSCWDVEEQKFIHREYVVSHFVKKKELKEQDLSRYK